MLRWCLIALSLLFIALFFYVAFKRMHYPFELERMESGVLTSSWRVAHGKPLYAKPTFEWAAYLYAPLYFYVSAWVMKFVGAGYQATRLVSTLSVAGIIAAIYAFVYLEKQKHLPALAAAGLYASLFSVLGAWYDLGRVDSFTTCLFLVALLATRYLPPSVAAVLWVVVFQAKQGFLPLPLVLFLFEYKRPWRMLQGMATYVALAAVSIGWMQHVSHGWYNFYVFGTAAQLGIVGRLAVLYIPNDLLEIVGVAALMIAAAVYMGVRDGWNVRGRTFAFYVWTSLLVFGLIGFVRAHAGSASNSLFPAYAWMAVLFGLAMAELLTKSERVTDPAMRNALASLILLAACVQVGMHFYNPGRWLPNADVLAKRTAFLEELRHAPGDVWVMTHSWDTVLAGKPLHPEMDAFDAVLFRPVGERTREATEGLHDAYANKRLSAVVMDSDAHVYLKQAGFQTDIFKRNYGLRLMAMGSDQPFLLEQPRYIYVPCDAETLPGDPWHTKDWFVDRRNCR